MMWQSLCVVALATTCLCQHQHQQSSNSDRQVRLEDIERDNLAANQKTAASPSQPPQQPSVTQQQIAAYQQQLLLQQLQQQYFAPAPLTYSNLGGLPLMIIPSNHLGLGNPAALPIQAFFVPADPYYQHQVYQSFPSQRYQQPAVPSVQTPSRLPQQLTYTAYRQPQNYPSASVVYAGTPTSSAYQQAQSYRPQQTTQQQLYNAYNALYQQQQEKNSFGAGIKSTPAPPLKPQAAVYSPQPANSQVYSNYKNFNYNQ